MDKPQVSFEDVVLGGGEEEKQLIPAKLTKCEKNVKAFTSSSICISFGSSLLKNLIWKMRVNVRLRLPIMDIHLKVNSSKI